MATRCWLAPTFSPGENAGERLRGGLDGRRQVGSAETELKVTRMKGIIKTLGVEGIPRKRVHIVKTRRSSMGVQVRTAEEEHPPNK